MVNKMTTTTPAIEAILPVSPCSVVTKGINAFHNVASAKKCASMALSSPNVQNNQPNARPPRPFKTIVRVMTRALIGHPMAAAVCRCAAPKARAKRTLAVHNTTGFGRLSGSWKSNPPSHASRDRPNSRKRSLFCNSSRDRGYKFIKRACRGFCCISMPSSSNMAFIGGPKTMLCRNRINRTKPTAIMPAMAVTLRKRDGTGSRLTHPSTIGIPSPIRFASARPIPPRIRSTGCSPAYLS